MVAGQGVEIFDALASEVFGLLVALSLVVEAREAATATAPKEHVLGDVGVGTGHGFSLGQTGAEQVLGLRPAALVLEQAR